MNQPKRIIVTGGAGFIGSALIRYLIKMKSVYIINVDKLTYAGNLQSLSGVENDPNYHFVKEDICNYKEIESIFNDHKPEAILHLAAESHVDRSIDRPTIFLNTNIHGTYTLLNVALEYWRKLPSKNKDDFRFLHVSTDEVFGSLTGKGYFHEDTPYKPNSPYSASKAGSDHLVRAWYRTYGLPTIITNCSNNYGPYQFPEKLIPVVILNAIKGNPIPVYGKGKNVRDWIYVDDHVNALWTVVEKGKVGETYLIGSRNEKTNINIVKQICSLMNVMIDNPAVKNYNSLIEFVEDRPGHDQRYAIDPSKIESELGWKPSISFEEGIRKTVEWYLGNKKWCDNILNGSYRLERLGLRGVDR